MKGTNNHVGDLGEDIVDEICSLACDGETERAISLWNGVKREVAWDYTSYSRIGRTFMSNISLDAAEEVFSIAAEHLPNNEWPAFEAARIAEARGDWIEATRRWDALIERFPQIALGYVGKGEALAKTGRLEDAERVLSEAIFRFPDDYWAGFHYALLATLRRAWSQAYERWDRVRERHPDKEMPYSQLAEALLYLGSVSDAMSLLDDAVTRFPESQQIAGFRARVRALRPVSLVGDLVKRGQAQLLRKEIPLRSVPVFVESGNDGDWSELPRRVLHSECDYVQLENVRLYNLYGCYGLVQLADGNLHSSTAHGAFNVHQQMHFVEYGGRYYHNESNDSISVRSPTPLQGEYFLPYRLAGTYYYHFVTETLQHIYDALRYWPASGILLPNSDQFFERIPRQVYLDAVKALAQDHHQNFTWIEEGVYEIERLTVPRCWVYGNCEFADQILRHLPFVKSFDRRVLYISRSNAARRRISNEATVIDHIRALHPDCQFVRLEEFSFIRQVELFRTANTVIAPHGGGLTNLVFCQPWTRIFEILPTGCPFMYRDLSQIRSLRYFAYRPREADLNESSYEISASAFSEALERATVGSR